MTNPFNALSDQSLYNSYNYYRKRYPHKSSEDIINRCIETRICDKREPFEKKEVEIISEPWTPPDGEIIYEDTRYIYYTDKVWSKDRWKIISTKYSPRLKLYKCYLKTKDNVRFLYTIGTIPTYITSKSSKK